MRAIRRDPDGGSRKDTGHTLICGPTGSGKTVFIGFLVAMLTRQGATQIIFDKDRGLEILVRALGGEYCPLKNGEPTGFNPLKLPPTSAQCRVPEGAGCGCWCARRPGALTVRQEADLDQALRGTLALRALRAAPVAPDRVSRRHRSRRASRAPCALVRVRSGATTPGCSTTPRMSIVPRLAGHAARRL